MKVCATCSNLTLNNFTRVYVMACEKTLDASFSQSGNFLTNDWTLSELTICIVGSNFMFVERRFSSRETALGGDTIIPLSSPSPRG